jgi:hypothetical protein
MKLFNFKICFKDILHAIKRLGLLALIIYTFVFLYSEFLYPFFVSLETEHLFEVIKILFAILGGSWILYEFYSRRIKIKNDGLKLSASIDTIENKLFIKTTIENDVYEEKDIKMAFLIIKPKDERDYLGIFSKEYNKKIESTNDLVKLDFINESSYAQGVFFIPLRFYYKENIRIGNEKLSYSLYLGSSIPTESSTVYEAYFYVYRQPNCFNGYHRVVQCSFLMSEDELKKNLNRKECNQKDDNPSNNDIKKL